MGLQMDSLRIFIDKNSGNDDKECTIFNENDYMSP